MTSPFVPTQFTARMMPPGDQLKQNTPLHQYYPSQAQNNQCDDSAPGSSYPSAAPWGDSSKPGGIKQSLVNGPERDGDVNEIRRLREENLALHMRLAEVSRNHQQQMNSLQTQLVEAIAARQAAEQRLMTMPTAAQASRTAANATMSAASVPPPVPAYQQQLQHIQRHPQSFAQLQQYQQQQTYHQQQQASIQPQPHGFHHYARQHQQQQQPSPAPSGNGQQPGMFQHASPALTSQAPPGDKKAAGGLFAYCTGFISASLQSTPGASASVMPSTGFKAAPSWKLFGRSRASEDDEETGRAAPLLPLQTPPTVAVGALRDPTV